MVVLVVEVVRAAMVDPVVEVVRAVVLVVMVAHTTNNATIYLNGARMIGDALAEGDVISIYGDIHVDHV